MYRYPDQAFGVFDFIGKGYVTAEDVANNPIIYKQPLTKNEVLSFLKNCAFVGK
jgi:hypothetical protein